MQRCGAHPLFPGIVASSSMGLRELCRELGGEYDELHEKCDVVREIENVEVRVALYDERHAEIALRGCFEGYEKHDNAYYALRVLFEDLGYVSCEDWPEVVIEIEVRDPRKLVEKLEEFAGAFNRVLRGLGEVLKGVEELRKLRQSF